jgi:hypothetical protein
VVGTGRRKAGTSFDGSSTCRRRRECCPPSGALPAGPRPSRTPGEGQEEYENGQVNDGIEFPPNTSSFVAFFAGYTAFIYYNKLHTFHSDELCGSFTETLKANPLARRRSC